MRFLILVLVLFGLACSKSEPKTPPSDSEPSEAPVAPSQAEPAVDEGAVDAPPTIELEDGGAEPRRVLHPSFEAGAKDKVRIEAAVTISAQMGPGTEKKTVIPLVAHTLVFEVKSVAPNGAATVGFEVISSEAHPLPETPADVLQKVKASTASIPGLQGTYQIDRQGLVTEVEMSTPAGSEGRDPHMAASIGEFLYHSTAPFPKEPVGTGAKWVVKRPLEEGGISFVETATYELQKADGPVVELTTKIERNAPRQKVGQPDPFELRKFTATGSGNLEVSLDQIAPTSATRRTKTELFMTRPGPSGSGIQSDLSVSMTEKMSRP